MREYKIAVIEGDGIGPEVIREGIKVLECCAKKHSLKFSFSFLPWGAKFYKEHKIPMPEDGIEILKGFDAIYMGAVGDPEVPIGVLERGLLLRIRFELDQYINLRPIKLYPGVEGPLQKKRPEDIDFVIVRENTQGLYCGLYDLFNIGKETVAIQHELHTKSGIRRCIHFAYKLAEKRKKKVTLCDKSNVLQSHHLWLEVFEEEGEAFPDIEKEHVYIDALCMWMVKNPERFDVIVTSNMFGDIISDLGAAIQGGLGLAAGANLNPEGISMFEPIHGSAPKYAGKREANPIATILAASLMLKYLGEEEAAKSVEEGVKKLLSARILKSMEAAKMGKRTDEVGDLVCSFIDGGEDV